MSDVCITMRERLADFETDQVLTTHLEGCEGCQAFQKTLPESE